MPFCAWLRNAFRPTNHLRSTNGGRLIYVGTGTSGRIGALDASECPPTFGISPDKVQFLIAGGTAALVQATEASEDSAGLGRRDMARRRPGKRDVIVGLAASGVTPYTISALEFARNKGAATIGIACPWASSSSSSTAFSDADQTRRAARARSAAPLP